MKRNQVVNLKKFLILTRALVKGSKIYVRNNYFQYLLFKIAFDAKVTAV